MPKAIPNASTVNAMTNPYRMIPGMTPQNGVGGSAAAAKSGNSAMSVDALGNATVDAKKAQMLGAKTLKEYEQARTKMAAKTPDLKMAESLLRDCIGIRNSIWGYSDPAMPKMLTLLGDVYTQQKHTSQAEACYKNALIYITKKDGSGSYERLDTLAKLGLLYNSTGSAKEAVPYYQQVAQIKERQSGATSADALKARLAWAEVAAAAGKADAGSLYKGLVDSLDKVDRSKAEYSQLQLNLVKSYGELLRKEGKLEESSALAIHFQPIQPVQQADLSLSATSVKPSPVQKEAPLVMPARSATENSQSNAAEVKDGQTIEQKLQNDGSQKTSGKTKNL